jgi:hypothetical protein
MFFSNKIINSLSIVSRIGLALFVASGIAYADTPEEPFTFSQPLSWFTGNSSPIAFKNERSSASFSIPIPANAHIRSVSLKLAGWNSPALLANSSTLLVSVNGTPAGIVSLDGNYPSIGEVVTLPANLFGPGYNDVTFNAFQTTGVTCEKFDDPALWTQLAATSVITITGNREAVVPSFNHLNAIFDKRTLSSTTTVTVLYDRAVNEAPDVLIGAAEGIGLRYDYVPVLIDAKPLNSESLSAALADPGNVVILAPDDAANQKEIPAELSLQPKADGVVLKITGGINAVRQAARLLGSDAVAWPPGANAEIWAPSDDHLWPVKPEKSDVLYFRGLGYSTSTLTGPKLSFGPVAFWNGNWGATATITMHLSYGAGGGNGAAMDVYANNVFLESIPLTSPEGGAYQDFRISVPRNALLSGRNELRFNAVISRHQIAGGVCVSQLPDSGVPVTLFSDSKVEITGGGALIPDNLAALTSAQTMPGRMLITDAAPGTFSAAATIAAKLAQVGGTADMKATFPSSHENFADSILIGPLSSLPPGLLSRVGIDQDPEGLAVHDLIGAVMKRKGPSSFQALPDWLAGPLRLKFQEILGPGQPIVIGYFKGAAVAAMAASSTAEVVLLTAVNSDDLSQGVNTLVDYGHWSQLAGHTAVIIPGQEALAVVPASIRPVGLRSRLGYAAGQHVLLALAGFLLLVLISIGVIRAALKYYHRRHGGNAPTKDGRA